MIYGRVAEFVVHVLIYEDTKDEGKGPDSSKAQNAEDKY